MPTVSVITGLLEIKKVYPADSTPHAVTSKSYRRQRDLAADDHCTADGSIRFVARILINGAAQQSLTLVTRGSAFLDTPSVPNTAVL